MKMEPIVSSETSAIKSQTPGNYPKRNKLHLQHGESLRTRLCCIWLELSINLTVIESSAFVHTLSHTRNIGHVNFSLQFIYYKTTYDMWTCRPVFLPKG